jgi:hypothetical protein
VYFGQAAMRAGNDLPVLSTFGLFAIRLSNFSADMSSCKGETLFRCLEAEGCALLEKRDSVC